MVVRVVQWTLDVADVELMARFWSAALGYRVARGDDGHAKLFPPPGTSPGAATMWLQGCGTVKHGKNRLHLDLLSDGEVQVEVDRLVGLGARPAEVGQRGDEPFVVLTDPEGNEFCVLTRPPRHG